MNGYTRVYREILGGNLPILILTFDDLQRDKNKQLRSILDFVGYHPTDLDERLRCLGRNDVGFFKRTKISSLSSDPYRPENVKDVNALIAELRRGLEKIGYNTLPHWERFV